jgi:GNAT superfamily N-acetyltransferase
MADVTVRVAQEGDAGALAWLRSLWTEGSEPGFEERMADWIAAEGERRTTWLATAGDEPAGMASMFEYRRMPRPGRPDARWGYVSNVFVRPELRDRGVGSMLLAAVIAAADDRGYVRLVLSPSARALPFYARAGFVVPNAAAGDDRLLVRPARPR